MDDSQDQTGSSGEDSSAAQPGKGLSRRGLLASGMAAAAGIAGAASTLRPARAAAATPPTTTDRRRAVVIGTGFGGGVTAMRLGQAGVKTLVLERGIRWPTGPNATTFPESLTPDHRSAWLSTTPPLDGAVGLFTPYTGLIERIKGTGMDVLVGAGVGGGSLVYHGMTIQPSAENFAKVLPLVDYGPMNADYYQRVARTLHINGIPDDILNSTNYLSSRLFLQYMGEQSGLTPFRVPMPIDWSFARRELTGELHPAYTNGDLLYGVNNGGKYSVDVTYVAAAEATGNVDVEILHVVRDIQRDLFGHWVIKADRIDTSGAVQEHKVITADALFLGTGAAGTTRLLLKAKGKNLISGLPDAVGTNFGTNGDRIYAWSGGGDLGSSTYQGGPACIGGMDWSNPGGALTLVHGPFPSPIALDLMAVIGFGITSTRGSWTYDANSDDAKFTYPTATDSLVAAIRARLDTMVAKHGGSLSDTTASSPSTYHPLGGAPMGSVTDTFGRVLGQRGLYVVDGSRVPGSTGACNPSMTIAALAERGMDTIIRSDVGSVF
jgi:cholesterol oxidase